MYANPCFVVQEFYRADFFSNLERELVGLYISKGKIQNPYH